MVTKLRFVFLLLFVIGLNCAFGRAPNIGCTSPTVYAPGTAIANPFGGMPTTESPAKYNTVTAYKSGKSESAPLNTMATNPANLAQLVISSGGLTPKFSVDTVNYKVLVAQSVTSVTIKPVAVYASSTIKVNGTAVASGATSAPISLNSGPNTITTVVTAQDGVTIKTYTITVCKGSTNAALSNVKLSSGTLSPAFNNTTYAYTATVASTVSTITVTPTAADATAGITVNGTVVTTKTASGPIPLAVGPNIITAVVTAQNGAATQTYTTTVYKGSTNAALSNLKLSNGTLSPVFNYLITGYTASVSNATSSMMITPSAADATATITVNGAIVKSKTASGPIALSVGPNVIATVVSAQNGLTTDFYTLTITRAPSTNAGLSSLSISNGILSPVFDPGTNSYTASVTNDIGAVTFTPLVSDAAASVTVNGIGVPPGSASGPVPLAVGSNTTSITVTAGDGVTTNTYTVTITRAPSTNASLSSLSISNGTLSPVFDPGTNGYAAGVTNDIGAVTISPLVSDATASVTVNGIGVPPGSASGPVPLAVGSNTTNITVTAGDGITTNTYTVTITRAPSINASLSSLSISDGTLSPVFDPESVNYTAIVDNTVNSVVITPIVSDPNASTTVNGTAITPVSPSTTIPLTPGLNTITVVVIAQDGTTTIAYTLTVTRQFSSDAELDDLTLSSGVLNPAFESDVTDYTASLNIVKKDHTIYTMGDSITANGEYQITLDSLLNQQFNIVNFAIRGDLTADMLARFPVIANASPDYVIILAGITDVSGNDLTVAEVETNLEAMYTEAHNAGIKVIALTMTPFKGNTNWTPEKQSEEDEINAWIPTAANVDFVIDTYSGLVDPSNPNHLLPQYDDSNHVHPTKAGQDEMAELIYSGVNFVPNPAVDQLNNANSSVTVTPVSDDQNETILVNNSSVNSGTASAPVPLSIGANSIVTTTTAQDMQTTKTYTINVIGNPSNNATLANLNLFNGGLTLSPLFSPEITNYTATEQYNLPNEVITATAVDTTAKITINGTAIKSGAPTDSIYLSLGPNMITTTVTAQDGTTTKTYTVVITRTATSNAYLSSLQLSNGIPLLPAFSVSQFKYVTNVSNAVTSVQVTPITSDNLAVVTVNNSNVLSGSPSKAINLDEGANTITTAVTSEDGTVKQGYVITITRALSSPNLAALHLSAGTLSPAFNSGVITYSASVTNGTASVTVTPTTTYSTATVTVNGVSVVSGTASASIPLSVGQNNISILVTAVNGLNQTYTVTVTRAASANANLARLLISKGTLSPTFAANTTSYTVSVANTVSTITVTPTTSDPTATVTVNGTAVTSGTASSPITLSVGSNSIATVATAQNGFTTNTYTITVIRAAPADNAVYQPVSVEMPPNSPTIADDGILVHRGISPNGDGVNDFLIIDNITHYPDNKLVIINRNGMLVYEARGYDNNSRIFDGHSNKTGQLQLPGTYFYSLDYAVNGVVKHKTGFIVLKY